MDIPVDQYAHYEESGIASKQDQILEVEAGNVALNFLALFVNASHINAEPTRMFRNIVDDVNRKTFAAQAFPTLGRECLSHSVRNQYAI